MRISLCSFAVILFCLSGHAQTFSVPVRHSTPYGNVTTYQQVGVPMYFNGNSILNRKHAYTIVLLNDSTIEKKLKIDINKKVHRLKWNENGNKRVITPKDTKEIFRIDKTGRKISGIPLDSGWAFLVDERKIRTYSITSELDDPLIGYIQKGAGSPILPLTKQNLVSMVHENERALELARKGRLLKALKKYNEL